MRGLNAGKSMRGVSYRLEESIVGVKMDTIVTIVSALGAGALAKAKEVGSQAILDAYNGLKALLVEKLGKGTAVQSVEDEPESDSARSVLVEALAKKELQADSLLKELAEL